jgi:hypothetical protein
MTTWVRARRRGTGCPQNTQEQASSSTQQVKCNRCFRYIVGQDKKLVFISIPSYLQQCIYWMYCNSVWKRVSAKSGVPKLFPLGGPPFSVGEHPVLPCAMSISMGTSTVHDKLFTPLLSVHILSWGAEKMLRFSSKFSCNSIHFAMSNVYDLSDKKMTTISME